MSRRMRRSVWLLATTMALSAAVGSAFAAKTAPKDGRYRTYATKEPGSPSYFTVSKKGRAVTFELNLAVDCEAPNGPLRTGSLVTSADLTPNGKAAPLTIVNGKFSYKGAVYGPLSGTGTGTISGVFKSPTKVVATVSFSWPSVVLLPGVEGPCESEKLTVSGSRE